MAMWPLPVFGAALILAVGAAIWDSSSHVAERNVAMRSCAPQCGERLFRIEQSTSSSPYRCLCMNDDGRYVPSDALENDR